MRVEVITRKWGNSIGVTLPKEIVEKEKIQPNEKITIDVHKKNPLKVMDIFGKLKLKKPVKQLMRDIDRDLEG